MFAYSFTWAVSSDGSDLAPGPHRHTHNETTSQKIHSRHNNLGDFFFCGRRGGGFIYVDLIWIIYTERVSATTWAKVVFHVRKTDDVWFDRIFFFKKEWASSSSMEMNIVIPTTDGWIDVSTRERWRQIEWLYNNNNNNNSYIV